MTHMQTRLHVAMLALVGLSIYMQPETASAKARSTTSALVTSALDLKSLATANARSALVSTAAEYCRDLDSAFPRNSPSEDVWLDREFAAGTDRSLRAMDSAEFSRRQAANFVSSCLSAAAAYNEGQRQFGLSLMVYAFVRFDGDAAIHAQRNSIAADEYGLPIMSIFVDGLAYAALKEAEQAGR